MNTTAPAFRIAKLTADDLRELHRIASSCPGGPADGATLIVDNMFRDMLATVRTDGLGCSKQLAAMLDRIDAMSADRAGSLADADLLAFGRQLHTALDTKLTSYVHTRKLAELVSFATV